MEKIKVLKFEKDGCVPCKIVGEFLDKENVTVDQKLNPFDEPDLAAKYRVRTVPKTILLNGDDVVLELNGAKIDELNSFVNKYRELVG